MEIWAKSNGLPLKRHTEDLLKIIENLPYGRLKVDIKDRLKVDIKELLKCAAFFHDLGKVSPKFQKRVGNKEYQIENFSEDFPDIRHNIMSLFFINKEKVKEVCKEDESLYTTFLSAIAFHHWKVDEKEYLLHTNKDLRGASELLLKNGNGEELTKILQNHFDKIDCLDVKKFITFDEPLAHHLKEGGNLISVNILPPYTLYFLPERLRAEIETRIDLNLWIFLAGFLIRADHFASLVEEEESQQICLKEVEKKIGRIDIFEKLKGKFGENFWQKEVRNYKNKNLILIAPTGIGKTEFAFLWAEEEKFFYTLPLRVATNQIFERACDYFNNRIFQNHKDPFINGNVGLLHSDADLYLYEKWESFNKDTDGEIPIIYDLSRHLSLPVNICTGDQIFPSGLKYPQYEKIYATLGYSKLIIDEVQAYDPRACAIVVKMIEDITSLGGKFLLMTATLPPFVKEYLQDKDILKDEDIINWYEGDRIKTDSKHKIELRNKDIIEDVDEIIKKAKEGNRVLVVLNTVEKAEEVEKKLNENEEVKNKKVSVKLIHSRFTLNERRNRECEICNLFANPKPQDEKEARILVATQVVEVSLDIDADYLFTEIAPMDSLIQRMGRIMRRIKYNQEYTQKESNIFVYFYFSQKSEKERFFIESGKGYVYENDILSITLCKLLELANLERLREVKEVEECVKKVKEVEEFLKSEEGKGRKTLNNIMKGLMKEIKRVGDQKIKIEIPLKEADKNKIVEEVYDSEGRFKYLKKSKYFQKFYDILSILNSGYVSENKEEAHRLFREISTIPVIEESKVEKIAERIKQELEKNGRISWLWFKREIIAEYVINDNIWRYKESELKSLIEDIKDEKVKRYCEGIWVIKKKKQKEEGQFL